MSTPAVVLACGVCRVAAAEEVIVFALFPDAPALRKSVCPSCCQAEVTRLHRVGARVHGITDA